MIQIARPLAALALFVLVSCSASVRSNPGSCSPGGPCPDGTVCGRAGECVAAAPAMPCSTNDECEIDSACLDGGCTVIGECTRDEHCGCDAPSCEDHVCVGSWSCAAGGGPPLPCGINADCPEKTYCIGGICQFTSECVEHADCPPGHGCFRGLCWEL